VEYKELLNSSDSHLWTECCAEEIGRLAQGYKCTVGTDTIHFIKIQDIPNGKKPTYLRLVVADRPNKENPRRVRFTVGGDKIDYPDEVATKTAELTTAKLLFNSVLSTPNAMFAAFDIKDFYLNTPMERFEYMRIPVTQIPQAIFDMYNLHELVHNGHVYVEIRKGMYGLPQAGILANKQLTKHLEEHGYIQSLHTPGLYVHRTRPIAFALVVDDFGIKYVGKEHAEHLLNVLQLKYTVTTNWKGDAFLGMSLKWNYDNRTLDISMPGYVERALKRFQHPPPSKPEHAPHAHIEPQYPVRAT
jgi:Reverse transcriptase (RNA-dependent DNA polymerase)